MECLLPARSSAKHFTHIFFHIQNTAKKCKVLLFRFYRLENWATKGLHNLVEATQVVDSKTDLLIFPLNPKSSSIFLLSAEDNSILSVTEAKTLGVILF